MATGLRRHVVPEWGMKGGGGGGGYIVCQAGMVMMQPVFLSALLTVPLHCESTKQTKCTQFLLGLQDSTASILVHVMWHTSQLHWLQLVAR